MPIGSVVLPLILVCYLLVMLEVILSVKREFRLSMISCCLLVNSVVA